MLISTLCENFIFFEKILPPRESFAPENLDGAPPKKFLAACPPEKNPERKPELMHTENEGDHVIRWSVSVRQLKLHYGTF